MISGKLLVLGLSVHLVVSNVVVPEKCVTPKEKHGKCVLLEDCPSIKTMSSDFETPMTLERLHFLINSQCKFEGGILTVCCSNEELFDIEKTIFQPLKDDNKEALPIQTDFSASNQ